LDGKGYSEDIIEKPLVGAISQYFLFLHIFRRNSGGIRQSPGIPVESAGMDRNSRILAESARNPQESTFNP